LAASAKTPKAASPIRMIMVPPMINFHSDSEFFSFF